MTSPLRVLNLSEVQAAWERNTDNRDCRLIAFRGADVCSRYGHLTLSDSGLGQTAAYAESIAVEVRYARSIRSAALKASDSPGSKESLLPLLPSGEIVISFVRALAAEYLDHNGDDDAAREWERQWPLFLRAISAADLTLCSLGTARALPFGLPESPLATAFYGVREGQLSTLQTVVPLFSG